MPYQLATWSFQYCCHLLKVYFSRKRCAPIISIGAAASKPTRPLIPIMVSPTCISRPIPYAAPISSTFWIALIGSSNFSSFTAFNSPFSKVRRSCSLPSLVTCFKYALSGNPCAESKISPPQIEVPQRPTLYEYFNFVKSAAKPCSFK